MKKTLGIPKHLRIINIGVKLFYDAAIMQHVEAVHVAWQPSLELDRDIEEILDEIGG
jgi:hypothetical protein